MASPKFVAAAAAAMLLSACGPQGEYYDKSPSAVVSALRIAPLPTQVMGGTVAGKRVTQPDEGTVVIAALDMNQTELVRFVATLTPDGSGTRVAVDVAPPEGRNKDRFAKASETNALAAAMLPALAKEHVDAAIDGRPFDMASMNPAAKMVPGMADANRVAADISKMEQQHKFESEYGDDWAAPE